MDLQTTINKAWELKKSGNLMEALKLYNEAFDTLISESSEYAHKRTLISSLSEKITPELFLESKRYLTNDNTACTISNNMAVIFAGLGDKESAKKFFEQSIELTPQNVEYLDPKIGLRELEK